MAVKTEETLEQLQQRRQELALDVQLRTKGATEELRKVEDKIAEHRRKEELRQLAEAEKRRRDEKAAQAEALAKQEEAKQAYLQLFEQRIEVNRQIEKQLDEVVQLLVTHKELGDMAFTASAKWGQPDQRLRRPEALVNMLHDYLGQVFPDDFVRRTSHIRSLAEAEAQRLEAMKHPNRKVAPAKVVKAEEPKTHIFSPVRTVVEIEEGRFTAPDDPKVRDEMAALAETNKRSVFVGGHQHPVTAYQADRLRLQGFSDYVRPKGEANE